MQHKILLQIINNNAYNNEDVCSVINIACIVYDFFTVYNKNEPDALIKTETMNVLLRDINKGKLYYLCILYLNKTISALDTSFVLPIIFYIVYLLQLN